MSDKEKILIADDSAMNRAILTEMLGDGYEILELARTGITGLNRGIKNVTLIDQEGNIKKI